MSTLIVEITKVLDINKHPNADKLELITVKGWQVVAQKDLYKIGDLVIYCPIDAVLPVELSDKMDVTKYLSKGRVKTVKLRGEYSQGLLIPISFIDDDILKSVFEGEDVKEVLGITKYEPAIPISLAGQIDTQHPDFHKYTDIENIKNFPDILKDGEEVIITEKIHGTNFRIGRIDKKTMVGSRNWPLKEDPNNVYWKAVSKFPQIFEYLPDGCILYGEVYGKGIQKLNYNKEDYTIAFFDLSCSGVYLNNYCFKSFCKNLSLPHVPILYSGPWRKELLSLAIGKSTIATHIKEGIVIKPSFERYDKKIGRVVLKHLSEEYLMKDYGNLH